VILEGVLGSDGMMYDLRTLRSPDVALENASLDALRQWRFNPTLLDCTPIDVKFTVSMNFIGRQ